MSEGINDSFEFPVSSFEFPLPKHETRNLRPETEDISLWRARRSMAVHRA